MSKLKHVINLTEHDEIYQMVIELQESLSESDRNKANAKLIFLLMNHIGDQDIIKEAIRISDPRIP